VGDKQERLINYKKDFLDVMHELVELFGDMAESSRANYIGKLYPARELCLGYLLLCRDNLKASIFLLENNQGHQLYFISRNIFELAVTLFYIVADRKEMSERVERYFEYNNSIKRQLGVNILRKLTELGYDHSADVNSGDLDQKCKLFKEKYGKGGKLRDDTWSGLNLVQMIECLSTQEKEELLQAYEIGIKISNSFLHPTRLSLRQAIEDFYSGKIDYEIQLPAASLISGFSASIGYKYLTQFPKGRPKFTERLDAIRNKLESFISKYKIGKRAGEPKPR